MPPALIPSDEEYASSEDEDFAPDATPAQEESSESEEEHEDEDSAAVIDRSKKKTPKRKRGDDEEAEDAGFENSGDEAIIERGLKRRKKKGKKGGKDEEEEDEGGEGGLIKTRSMRAQEKVEKKPLADTKAVTVDVDALWASMISGKPAPSTASEAKSPPNSTSKPISSSQPGSKPPELHRGSSERSNFSEGPNSMIMIRRTYNFAGKVITEQKLVPKDSAEAKLFLASQESAAAKGGDAGKEAELFVKPKRGLKKARRSIFEPVMENFTHQRTDLYFGTAAAVRLANGKSKEAKKLNTVEKSAMDWAGFVDKEGIKDELNAAGKKKGAYGERQAFLARVEAKKEVDERRARGLPV
ncbi:hypothetical protein DSL72_007807 [Monilinia vaccinii-corymbosi]|uniref:SWR1-complex protein 5 n=1 Tax=Monilinia vaccinii-corymbosi TaxID=61207 RepID=A0A8A3PIT0_9HELO|nr:hypothetical protein DSL72_007807 [Monilinia vaccinii-corymbosi]